MYKILVVIIFLVILGSLASGLVYLIRDNGESNRTVKALTWRVSLSIGLFLLLMLGYATGLLQPHGTVSVPPENPPAASQE